MPRPSQSLNPNRPRRRPRRRRKSAAASSRAGSATAPVVVEADTSAPRALDAPREVDAATGPSVADIGELERVAAEVRAFGESPAPVTATEEAADLAEDALMERAERVMDGDGQALVDFDAADYADMYQLAFGLRADVAGKHWELNDRQARRLGSWTKKVIDRHGLAAAMKYAPEVFTVLLLGYEIGKRWRVDRVTAAEKAAAAKAQ